MQSCAYYYLYWLDFLCQKQAQKSKNTSIFINDHKPDAAHETAP